MWQSPEGKYGRDYSPVGEITLLSSLFSVRFLFALCAKVTAPAVAFKRLFIAKGAALCAPAKGRSTPFGIPSMSAARLITTSLRTERKRSVAIP